VSLVLIVGYESNNLTNDLGMSNLFLLTLFRELAEPSSSSSLRAASGQYADMDGVHHHQRGSKTFIDHVYAW
jgi:hypothetical protein